MSDLYQSTGSMFQKLNIPKNYTVCNDITKEQVKEIADGDVSVHNVDETAHEVVHDSWVEHAVTTITEKIYPTSNDILNGKVDDGELSDNVKRVLRPEILSPVANSEVDITLVEMPSYTPGLVVVSSAFKLLNDKIKDIQMSQDWVIAKDTTMTDIVLSAMDSEDLITHTFTVHECQQALEDQITYYLFTRMRSRDYGDSDWSLPHPFVCILSGGGNKTL